LKETVKYTPYDLDKESPEFRENLAYLGDSFTFHKDQMQVFFEQLRERVTGAVEQESTTNEDSKDVIDLRSDDDMYA